MLWVEGEWGEAEVGSEVEEQTPKSEIGSIEWSSAKGVRHKTESDTPHFYSDMRGRGAQNYTNRKRFRRD